MILYFSYIAFLILLWIVLKGEKKKLIFIIIASFALTLIIGLRDKSVGIDTKSYCEDYLRYHMISWKQIMNGGSHIGFYAYSKILSMIAPNSYTFFLFVTGAIISISLGFFIYKNSTNPLLSFIIVFSLEYVFFFMSGLKQTLAMSLLMVAYQYMKDKKIIKFGLLILLATLFHTSALIFVIAYPVFHLKLKKSMILIFSILLVFIGVNYSSNVFYIIRDLIGDSLFDQYGGDYISSLNYTGLFIQIALFALVYILLYVFSNEKYNGLINILILGLFFQSMTGILGEFFRIAMYFNMFIIIALPNAIGCMKKEKTLTYLIVGAVLLLYFSTLSIRNFDYSVYKFFLN